MLIMRQVQGWALLHIIVYIKSFQTPGSIGAINIPIFSEKKTEGQKDWLRFHNQEMLGPELATNLFSFHFFPLFLGQWVKMEMNPILGSQK